MAQLPDSPFGRFFNVNTPPTAEECSAVRSFMRPLQGELSALENEISRLQTLVEDLILRRDPITKYISQHQNIISPIRRLPSEVLSQIFIACLPTAHHATRDLTQAPLIFTVISRRFRDVALSTPQLWNSIHLTILPSYNDPKDFNTEEYIARVSHRRDGVKLWLERSAALPLSFSLVLERKIYESGALGDLLAATKLLEVFTQHHLRWKDVYLRVSRDIEIQILNRFASDEHFPILQHLKVDTYSRAGDVISFYNELDDDATLKLQTRVLERSPALQILHMHAPIHTSPSVPSNLTHLTLLSTPSSQDQHLEDDLFKLSKETPHLHSLALAAAFLPDVRSPERVNNSIVFSKLHTLEFHLETLWFYAEADIGEVAFTRFFDSIHTPVLRRLSIMIQEIEDISVTWKCIQVAPFRNLISRVSAGLQDLCLDVPMAFETLVDCLGRLQDESRLESLEVREPTHARWMNIDSQR
ncbi:hypothetical protein PQX77_009001 [Marasmius sp. AFHP31]|nr:hypothetical protein PQX77_009001 [Marasmius sp. AFHP31]